MGAQMFLFISGSHMVLHSTAVTICSHPQIYICNLIRITFVFLSKGLINTLMRRNSGEIGFLVEKAGSSLKIVQTTKNSLPVFTGFKSLHLHISVPKRHSLFTKLNYAPNIWKLEYLISHIGKIPSTFTVFYLKCVVVSIVFILFIYTEKNP